MKNDELKPVEQTPTATAQVQDHSRVGGGPTTSGMHGELSDADLGRVAGGAVIVNMSISTITDLADEDLRQVAGGPPLVNM
jgi:hypothetical protein